MATISTGECWLKKLVQDVAGLLGKNHSLHSRVVDIQRQSAGTHISNKIFIRLLSGNWTEQHRASSSIVSGPRRNPYTELQAESSRWEMTIVLLDLSEALFNVESESPLECLLFGFGHSMSCAVLFKAKATFVIIIRTEGNPTPTDWSK